MAKASVCMRSVLVHPSTTSTHFSLQKTAPPLQQPRLRTLAHALSVDGRRSGSEPFAQRLPEPDLEFESSSTHLSSLWSRRQRCRLSSPRMSFPPGRRPRLGSFDRKHRRNDPPVEQLSLSLPIKRTTLITSSADSSSDTAGWPVVGSPAPGDGWPKTPPPLQRRRSGRDDRAAEGDVAFKAMMAFKKGLEKKDWKEYLDMMTDDVKLWVPIQHFTGKEHIGKESMKKFFDVADSTFSTLTVQIVNRSYSSSLFQMATGPSTPPKSSRSGSRTLNGDGDGDGDGDDDGVGGDFNIIRRRKPDGAGVGHSFVPSRGDDTSTRKVVGTAMFEITTSGKFVKENKDYGNRIVVVVGVEGNKITAHREYFGVR